MSTRRLCRPADQPHGIAPQLNTAIQGTGAAVHGENGKTNVSRRTVPIPALTTAELPQHTAFHTLRRSYASTALAAGLPILDLSRHLGHATTAEPPTGIPPPRH